LNGTSPTSSPPILPAVGLRPSELPRRPSSSVSDRQMTLSASGSMHALRCRDWRPVGWILLHRLQRRFVQAVECRSHDLILLDALRHRSGWTTSPGWMRLTAHGPTALGFLIKPPVIKGVLRRLRQHDTRCLPRAECPHSSKSVDFLTLPFLSIRLRRECRQQLGR
jgi:hypothetical protein